MRAGQQPIASAESKPIPAYEEQDMIETRALRATTASALSLMVGGACIAAFLPPMLSATLSSVTRIVLTALTLATALVLHWVFLGIAARSMARSAARWVATSILLFPVGSIAALVLLNWLIDEDQRDAVPAHG
jgi:CBS domain containing-hemolysin-like protein